MLTPSRRWAASRAARRNNALTLTGYREQKVALKEGVVMKIKILTGPNAGTFTHTENTQDALLQEKLGNIEIIRYKDFRERLTAESNPAAAPTVVEWGIRPAALSSFGCI